MGWGKGRERTRACLHFLSLPAAAAAIADGDGKRSGCPQSEAPHFGYFALLEASVWRAAARVHVCAQRVCVCVCECVSV